jgi:hypothetical protein
MPRIVLAPVTTNLVAKHLIVGEWRSDLCFLHFLPRSLEHMKKKEFVNLQIFESTLIVTI